MMPSPWQDAAYNRTMQAYLSGRLGHAQLLTGPEHLGKLALAVMLAKRLLCRDAGVDLPACGRCLSCRRFEQGSHGDFRQVGIELNEKTGKLKTAIGVDQIRDMAEWLALTAQLGGARVVIVETAHRLNVQAANALLKTLEEPMPGRYLILVTDQAKALPVTVRSRCQRLEMPMPSAQQARSWLSQQGMPEQAQERLLPIAGGNPGVALDWHGRGGMALFEAVHGDLAALAKDRLGASEAARAWLADDQTAMRLLFAAGIAYRMAGTWALGGKTGPKPPLALHGLQDWIDGINRLRLSLSQPLRHDLGLAGLLHDWRQLLHDFRQD
jgi:DNA polymerase III subunit delta'